MSVGRIANRYAKSLLDLSIEQNQLEDTATEIKALKTTFASKEFINFLKSPIIKADKKLAVFNSAFGDKFSSVVKPFVQLVIKKGREEALPEICDEFLVQYKNHKGVSGVKIISASPLSTEAQETIKKKLETSSHTKSAVELDFEVDESLIGGFKIELGDRLYDDSVAHKLELLRKEFSN